MTIRISVLAALVLGIVASLLTAETPPATTMPATAPAPLAVLKTWTADGNGGWDYLTVDPEARRIYVARATRVTVFDADTGAVIGEVADTPGVHGIALVAKLNLGFATCAKDGKEGKDGTVAVFDLKTLKITQRIPAGKKPDSILYDTASGKIFAFNGGSGDVTIIDPNALDKAPETLAIGGKLEFCAADGKGHVCVNVEDKGEVVVIDSKKLSVIAHLPLGTGKEPTGMAMDLHNDVLYVGCSNKRMIVLETYKDGKVIADLAIGDGVDGVAYCGVAVSANGRDGTLTVVAEGPAAKYGVVQTLKTVKGARTVAADPVTHQFYLPCMIPDANGKTSFGLVVVGVPPEKKDK
jgi:DNA-binding beta-propeller fold protein YncE